MVHTNRYLYRFQFLGSTAARTFTATAQGTTSAGGIRWSLESGAPAGMTIDQATGEITWDSTGVAVGTRYDITLRATNADSGQQSSAGVWSLTVVPSRGAAAVAPGVWTQFK